MRLSGGNIRFLAADEPTSALDPEGEFRLFKKLKKHRGEKTVVFITHRLSTARRADKIAMMEHGVSLLDICILLLRFSSGRLANA